MSPLNPLKCCAQPAVVAMVHVAALPGAPRHSQPLREIVRAAEREAALYLAAGVDALLIENMHDVPYLRQRVGPEIVAAMTAVGQAVRARTPELPLGVQILAGANRAALAVALACEAAFIRAENFVFAHVADEGLMGAADAGPLLRYRRRIGAEHIAIAADLQKKHAAHALTADLDLKALARAAEFCGADTLIVTGATTGSAARVEDLRRARSATPLPVWVGSGVTEALLPELWPHVDALVVGSHFKQDGRWDQPVARERVESFMSDVRALRGGV